MVNTIACVAAPVLLLAFGMPIFLVFLFSAVLFQVAVMSSIPLQAVPTAIFGSLDGFALLAVPLFIFAGDIMARGGIARRLIEFILSMIGGIRGSLPVATVASASAFGAMSGSSVACVAAIGKLTLPSLEKSGYGRTYSVSLITATGVIDVIIPPSIPMILYAVTAQQPVNVLFLAGIVPGLLIGAALCAYVVWRARRDKMPPGEPVQIKQVIERGRNAVWAIFAPVLILGGIYGGIFTATEAAGIACVYAIVVSVFIHKELSIAQLWGITKESSMLVGQIMIIVAAAGAYSWLITTSGLPTRLVEFISGLQMQTWMLLLVINVVLLFIGSVLEPPAAILLLAPLLTPVAYAAGVDPIHFGLIVTVNLAVGLFMPPFGLNLFATNALFKTPLPLLYRGVLPFFCIYVAVLLLLTYVPAITLAPLALFK
jgi:C4-dicarboxylate transporter DctM subunit